MPPRLRGMMFDLKSIKTELLSASGKEPELEDYDQKMLDLTRLLQDVRTGVDRLNEFRCITENGRDINTIRIANDNITSLKKASNIWNAAKQMLLRDAATKKIDEKTFDDRKRKLMLVFNEIRDLSNKNSSPSIKKTAVEIDIDRKKADREHRRKKSKGKSSQNNANSGDDKSTPDTKDIELHPHRYTDEEQKFFEEVQKNKEEQDKMIGEILKGVWELGDIANGIKTQIQTSGAMIEELDMKLDNSADKFKSSNAKLQDTLEEIGGFSRWCPVFVCLIILLACAGYLYSQL